MRCLPELSQPQLEELHNRIVKAVIAIPQLGVKSEDDMLNLFTPDSMKYGLGSEVRIDIKDVEGGWDIRKLLAREVGMVIKHTLPDTKVHCFAHPPDPSVGFWSSEKSNTVQEMLTGIESKSDKECPCD